MLQPTSCGINYCLTSSGNSLMCVWSIEVIFHSLLALRQLQQWQISRSRPQRATELIYFFRIVNLYLHILITCMRACSWVYWPGGIYEDIVGARENNYSFLRSLSNSLEKINIAFVHTRVSQRLIFLCHRDYEESIKHNWDDSIECVS